MLNIDKKTIKKNKKQKKQIKNRFFYKKTFFIEIKKQKIKNGFLYNTSLDIGRKPIADLESTSKNMSIKRLK